MYDPSKDGVCLSVSLRMIGMLIAMLLNTTSCKNFFVALEDGCHKVGTISCANSAYIMKGISQVHITIVNGDVATLTMFSMTLA